MNNKIFIVTILVLNIVNAQCIDSEYSTVGVLDDINEEIYNDDESVNNYSFKWL